LMMYISMIDTYSQGTVSYTVMCSVIDNIISKKIETTWHPWFHKSIITKLNGVSYRGLKDLIISYVDLFKLENHSPVNRLDVNYLDIHPDDQEEYDNMIIEYPLYMENPNLVDWDLDPLSLWYVLSPETVDLYAHKYRPYQVITLLLTIRRLTKELICSFKEAHPEYVFPSKKSAMSAVVSY